MSEDRPTETGTLRFNLDSSDGRVAMMRSLKSMDMALALAAIRECLRQREKYGPPGTCEELTQAIRDIISDHVAKIHITADDNELRNEALRLNSSHGHQLSKEDKKRAARLDYEKTPPGQRAAKKVQLTQLLSVPERTLRNWLQDIDQETDARRDRDIMEMWWACCSNDEVADALGCGKTTVADVVKRMVGSGRPAESDQAHAGSEATVPPYVYNIWQVEDRREILTNLLMTYTTDPSDIVVAPFAVHSGAPAVCLNEYRRYFATDVAPSAECRSGVRTWNVLESGPHDMHHRQLENVRMVYIDPPTDTEPEWLGNLINAYAAKVPAGVCIALVVEPVQTIGPALYVDRSVEVLKKVELPLLMRFSCPLAMTQFSGEQVELAKAKRQTIVLTREVLVWTTGIADSSGVSGPKNS
jgi:hypothetical protein